MNYQPLHVDRLSPFSVKDGFSTGNHSLPGRVGRYGRGIRKQAAPLQLLLQRIKLGRGQGDGAAIAAVERHPASILLALTFARDSYTVYRSKSIPVMKRHSCFLIVVLCSMGLVPVARAHVTLTNPKGGETFTPGSQVKIEWQLDIAHTQDNWDLYFSSDGGVTWESLAADLPVAARSYEWTVPEIETTEGRIKVIQDNQGLDYVSSCDNFSIQAVSTAAGDPIVLPASTRLVANYPNPFTTSTSIEFVLPRPQRVRLEIFDLHGLKVGALVSTRLAAGRHRYTWSPSGAAAGVYLVRLEADDRTQTRSLVLAR